MQCRSLFNFKKVIKDEGMKFGLLEIEKNI
jgi:hypothetical protein